jgi:transcription elongation factor Elf1
VKTIAEQLEIVLVRDRTKLPMTRPQLKCPECGHTQTIRKQLKEGSRILCAKCKKRSSVMYVKKPEFFLPDMAHADEYVDKLRDIEMPKYIYDLSESNNTKEAYTQFCLWKKYDPNETIWDGNR